MDLKPLRDGLGQTPGIGLIDLGGDPELARYGIGALDEEDQGRAVAQADHGVREGVADIHREQGHAFHFQVAESGGTREQEIHPAGFALGGLPADFTVAPETG